MIAFLQGIGAPELILILAFLLLIFGAKKLPELARSIGKSSKEFKKGLREGGEPDDKDKDKADSAKDGEKPQS